MTFPHSHKTIVILDHSPYFAESSNQSIDFDIFNKSRGVPGMIPLAPITKSLWTCNVEASLEYCRIVWDIFPTKKLIRFITSDVNAISLNSWSQSEQTMSHLTQRLAHEGAPNPDEDADDCSVMHGLALAIEALCTPSHTQHQVRTSLTVEASKVVNRGRIICLTSVKSDAHITMLEECVQDALVQHNKLAASTDNLMPIFHCELHLVHVTPLGNESSILHKDLHDVSSLLSSQVHVTQSGRYMAAKMVQMAQNHYDLTSTAVTGIPMKEEQNASSSANYDVELLHPKEAHRDLIRAATDTEGMMVQSKDLGFFTETVTLKWCTPKSNIVEMHHCTGCFRISPVDVNSRPSSCLTNFLLSGRAVMLEQPRKTGSKIISHMLASHGGEIYIHNLSCSRSNLEDPPSISEGCGGRVTDYRITDFGEFMKECRLAPKEEGESEVALTRAKSHLEKMTRIWPMVIGESIIFNILSHIDPIPSLIVKGHLDEDEVLECKKAIYHVVGMESRNEPLPVAAVGSRGKGPKREEQYKQMWSELEQLVRAHVDNSEDHQKILECILECRQPDSSSGKAGGSPTKRSASQAAVVKEEKMDTSDPDSAWAEINKFQRMTERDRSDLNIKSEIKTIDSPPAKRLKSTNEQTLGKSAGPQSLLSMWTNRIKSVHSLRHAEFAGRLESSGTIAELYPHLKEKEIEIKSESNTSSNMPPPQDNNKPSGHIPKRHVIRKEPFNRQLQQSKM